MEEKSFELKLPTTSPAPLRGMEARAGQGRGCRYCQGSASYTCPRCSVNYCGLKCYQSEAHRECSEGFYKECVERELHGQGLGEESKKKMQDILHRVHREEEEEEDFMDSDDEEDAEELEKRLEGVDLEDTNKVWSSLTKEEKRQFQEMVNSGELVGLMPEYTPWWKQRVVLKKIVEVDEEKGQLDETLRKNCPEVCETIPSLRNVVKNPSPFIKFGLLNLLYGYAYAVKFFNGDYNAGNGAHFVEIIQLLASTLDGQNFDLADTAVEAAASEVNNHNWLTVSLEHSRNVKKDVYELVKGPTGEDNFYILSALSDLKTVFEATVKDLKKGSKRNKNIEVMKAAEEDGLPAWLSETQQKPELELARVRKHLKKIEFYLSWTQDFYGVFKEL